MIAQKIKLILLFICLQTLAQAQGIQDMSNTIIITFNDSTTVRDKVLKTFASKEYVVRNPNKATKIIYTEAKTLKSKTRVGLYAEIKGAEVYLTGKIIFTGQEGVMIQNKGDKGTHALYAWEEMDKVGKAFGGTVSYKKR